MACCPFFAKIGVFRGTSPSNTGGRNLLDADRDLRHYARNRVSREDLELIRMAAGHAGVEQSVADRFQLLSLIGEGATGVVHRAFDRQHDLLVALKRLKHPSPSFLLRFKREFRALQDSRLQHVNLVRLRELFEEDGQWYVSMELVDGPDLLNYVRPGRVSTATAQAESASRIRTLEHDLEADSQAPAPLAELGMTTLGTLDETRLRSALIQLCSALVTLHDAGFVHRDVKPSNVRVGVDGRVVLLDFGLVIEAETQLLERAGTPYYMAPEQATARTLSPAADQFALGVVLYETLTGVLPYAGSASTVQRAKESGQLLRPALFHRQVPADLEALCLDLLQVDPRLRPTGRTVLERLNRHQHQPSVAVAPEEIAVREQSQPRTALFVGRDAELEALSRALQESRRRLVVVSIVGDSGVGKSALVRRFSGQHASPGGLSLLGQCFQPEYVGFNAFDGVVDQLVGALAQMPSSVVESLVPLRAELLTRAFPMLRALPAFARERQSVRLSLDPREHRPLVCAAFRELLRGVARELPLLLAIDDLQWGDEDSRFMLEMLLSAPDSLPLLLLVASRRGADVTLNVAEWLGRLPGDVREIRLAGLDQASAEELAAVLLADGAEPGTTRSIAREAGGHPLFIEELCRSARRNSVRDLDEALRERCGELSDDVRRTLELVAISGSPIDVELLGLACAEERGSPLAIHLGSLNAARLTRTTLCVRGERVELYHSRIGRALLGGLDASVLRARHAALAHAAHASGSYDLEFLARNWFGAGEVERAVAAALKAAEQAASALAFEHAVRLLRWALHLGVTADREIGVMSSLANALANAGRGSEAAELYLKIAAREGGAPELERRASEQLLRVGRLTEARGILARVLDREGLRSPRTKLEAVLRLLFGRLRARLRGYSFHPRPGETTAEDLRRVDICRSVAQGLAAVEPIEGALYQTRQLHLALGAGEPQRAALALAVEATLLAWGGSKATKRMRAALTSAEVALDSKDDPYTRGYIQWATGVTTFLSCQWRESLADFRRSEELFRRGGVGVSWELAMSRVFSLWSQAHLGHFQELARSLPAEIEVAERVGDLLSVIMLRTGKTNLFYLATDRCVEARAGASLERLGWSQPGFQFQHALEMAAHNEVDLYEGSGHLVLERLANAWSRLRWSGMLALQYIRVTLLDQRGRAALMTRDGARLALRCARGLDREELPYAASLAALLRAGVARARRLTDAAAHSYRTAALQFESQGLALHAAATRVREGELTHSMIGRAMRDQALIKLAQAGVCQPEKMVTFTAP